MLTTLSFQFGRSALFFAVENNHEEIVKYQIEKGANVDAQNKVRIVYSTLLYSTLLYTKWFHFDLV